MCDGRVADLADVLLERSTASSRVCWASRAASSRICAASSRALALDRGGAGLGGLDDRLDLRAGGLRRATRARRRCGRLRHDGRCSASTSSAMRARCASTARARSRAGRWGSLASRWSDDPGPWRASVVVADGRHRWRDPSAAGRAGRRHPGAVALDQPVATSPATPAPAAPARCPRGQPVPAASAATTARAPSGWCPRSARAGAVAGARGGAATRPRDAHHGAAGQASQRGARARADQRAELHRRLVESPGGPAAAVSGGQRRAAPARGGRSCRRRPRARRTRTTPTAAAVYGPDAGQRPQVAHPGQPSRATRAAASRRRSARGVVAEPDPLRQDVGGRGAGQGALRVGQRSSQRS